MHVCFVKNTVDREWIFLYYNQKDYCKDDEWKSSYIVIFTASWEWCEPVIWNIMKIIHELRAELFSKLRRASFEELPPVIAREV